MHMQTAVAGKCVMAAEGCHWWQSECTVQITSNLTFTRVCSLNSRECASCTSGHVYFARERKYHACSYARASFKCRTRTYIASGSTICARTGLINPVVKPAVQNTYKPFRSRKCIWGHVPMHEIFAAFIYFFIPVLSRSSFTSSTPDKKPEDRATLLLSSCSSPITRRHQWAPHWTFLCMLSASVWKSASRRKWHVLVPLDGFPLDSSWVALQYETGTKFFLERFPSYTKVKIDEKSEISVQPRGVFIGKFAEYLIVLRNFPSKWVFSVSFQVSMKAIRPPGEIDLRVWRMILGVER